MLPLILRTPSGFEGRYLTPCFWCSGTAPKVPRRAKLCTAFAGDPLDWKVVSSVLRGPFCFQPPFLMWGRAIGRKRCVAHLSEQLTNSVRQSLKHIELLTCREERRVGSTREIDFRHSKGPPRLPHPLERRRSRHPHPEASQSGVRGEAIAPLLHRVGQVFDPTISLSKEIVGLAILRERKRNAPNWDVTISRDFPEQQVRSGRSRCSTEPAKPYSPRTVSPPSGLPGT